MNRPLALISVSDKTGVADFARALHELGYEILSTGGTGRAIAAAGVPVTKVSAHTGAPEMFDGRVKTLHPKIHGGILGRRAQDAEDAAANDVRWIDVVAVNLYPFEATVEAGAGMNEAMEKVDIGGPCMVRAAAKNHRFVTVVTDPADYGVVTEGLRAGRLDEAERRRLAVKAFRHTAAYDAIISGWLADQLENPPELIEGALPLRRVQPLRYGENPHQSATFYAQPLAHGRSLARAVQLQGKALSYNNLSDLDGALRCVFDFEGCAAVVVKHGNPCGAAESAEGPGRAFELALSGDPVSAFGSILAFNRPLTADDVRAVRRSRLFVEVLAAPGFSEEARALLTARKNLRVMELPVDWARARPAGTDLKRVQGGWLMQDWDLGAPVAWRVVTERAPTADEERALRFAWRACRHVKSNAIVLATTEGGDPLLNGVGAGQMSRVDAAMIAVRKATRPTAGSVMASDAFFPFADGLEAARGAGVTAVIQPGGSKRDAEVIAAADEGGLAMVFTGARHFRH